MSSQYANGDIGTAVSLHSGGLPVTGFELAFIVLVAVLLVLAGVLMRRAHG